MDSTVFSGQGPGTHAVQGGSGRATAEGVGVLRLELTVELQQPLHLRFLGSALRGAWGHALKVVCDYLGQPWLYAQIFEKPLLNRAPEPLQRTEGALKHKGALAEVPAYVISPPMPVSHGQHRICFGMTLMGEATAHAALIEQAWRLVFLRGLGPDQVRGTLVSVVQRSMTEVLEQADQWQEVDRWRLETSSPVFIKNRELQPAAQSLCADQMSWLLWLHALYRRLRHVQRGHAGLGQEAEPFSQWVEWQAGLKVQATWQDEGYTRYSARQLQHIPVRGVMGKLWIQGRLPLPLLRALLLGQWLHAGSKTALGLGAYWLAPCLSYGLGEKNLSTSHPTAMNEGGVIHH